MATKGEMTKEQILQAAFELFSEKGFDGAGIRELAERAGVPKSLLYYHFKNKDAILHELIGGFFTEIETVFGGILAESMPGEWNFSRVAMALEELFTRRSEAIRIVFAVAFRSPDVRSAILGNLVEFQKKMIVSLEAHGVKVHDRLKMLMERFFFGFGPFFMFQFFRVEWNRMTGMDQAESAGLFRELMTDQIAFHSGCGWKRGERK